MKTVCEKNRCVGCMVCVETCPRNAIKIEDNMFSYNAVINEESCVNCHQCYYLCQNNNEVRFTRPIMWKQGWATNDDIRMTSSSGGLAQAIELAFISSGGIVCSCSFENGVFGFAIAKTKDEIKKFRGSKYIKSTPLGVYKEIKTELQNNKKVLFVGLPCQVAALKRFVGEGAEKELYTIDLICHGTPSPKVLDLYLKQHGVSINDLSDIQFRKNNVYGLRSRLIDSKGGIDNYLIAFLNSICFTESCYNCQYAKTERVSDITLGDSWGSDLPDNEIKKGISLVLCQTEKGKKILELSDLKLFDVEPEKAVENNHQLKSPSEKPEKREYFLSNLKAGKSFDSIIRMCYPKQWIKQRVKEILKLIHLYK